MAKITTDKEGWVQHVEDDSDYRIANESEWNEAKKTHKFKSGKWDELTKLLYNNKIVCMYYNDAKEKTNKLTYLKIKCRKLEFDIEWRVARYPDEKTQGEVLIRRRH